jgi:hypothetical protein
MSKTPTLLIILLISSRAYLWAPAGQPRSSCPLSPLIEFVKAVPHAAYR